MRQSDITEEQIKRAALFTHQALIKLRESGAGGWWDDDYRNFIDDSLFFGRYWRRVARITSVEDAKRELLQIAERIGERLEKKSKERL